MCVRERKRERKREKEQWSKGMHVERRMIESRDQPRVGMVLGAAAPMFLIEPSRPVVSDRRPLKDEVRM